MFSISDSINHAYMLSKNTDLKAEIYLFLYRKNMISKEYTKSVKKIIKLSYRIDKSYNKGKSQNKRIKIELEKKIEKEKEIQKKYLEEAKKLNEISDTDLISKKLINRFRQGLMIKDTLQGFKNAESSYGRLVYSVFKRISSSSLFNKVKVIVGKSKPSYFQKVCQKDKRIKEKHFLDTKDGALLIESYFFLFLINRISEDLQEDQKQKLIEEILKEIEKDDPILKKKIEEMFKGASLASQFSTIILQIIRLSVGKGIFMNSAVKITNIMLRFFLGKGMTYAKNAVFRKFLAKYLGRGLFGLILNIVLCIPDAACLINRRDYFAILNVIMRLYLLRNEKELATT